MQRSCQGPWEPRGHGFAATIVWWHNFQGPRPADFGIGPSHNRDCPRELEGSGFELWGWLRSDLSGRGGVDGPGGPRFVLTECSSDWERYSMDRKYLGYFGLTTGSLSLGFAIWMILAFRKVCAGTPIPEFSPPMIQNLIELVNGLLVGWIPGLSILCLGLSFYFVSAPKSAADQRSSVRMEGNPT